jgi:hypothetical protein
MYWSKSERLAVLKCAVKIRSAAIKIKIYGYVLRIVYARPRTEYDIKADPEAVLLIVNNLYYLVLLEHKIEWEFYRLGSWAM